MGKQNASLFFLNFFLTKLDYISVLSVGDFQCY